MSTGSEMWRGGLAAWRAAARHRAARAGHAPAASRAWPLALAVSALALAAGCAAQTPAPAPAPAAAAPAAPPARSALDAQLFYQLLIGELELRGGEPGAAYQIILDAARRTRDEALFRRSVEIALQARAGEQALAATRAWRDAAPASLEAARYEIQLLLALNRTGELAAPLRTLLERSAPADRPGMIAALPRLFQRQPDATLVAQTIEPVLRPYLDAESTRVAARVTLARLWRAAGERERALALLRQAAADDPAAPGPTLLAIEMMGETPQAEEIVRAALRAPHTDVALRLAYARALAGAQRYPDAVAQLEDVTRLQPGLAPAWLTLGALRVELREPVAAEQALQRYLELVQTAPGAPARGSETASDADERSDARDDESLTQAWLLLAQAAEQRGDLQAAEQWLARIENPEQLLQVQTRRAVLLARRGDVDGARNLVRAVPERTLQDARAKVLAETQVLREVRRWADAYAVLDAAAARFPDDTDLLYEQAMMAEKMDRLADMERLLRRVIEMRPDHHHAYNALGYSLADRNLRLDEARALIVRALELAPGDPFITDSLAWVEYRAGNLAEALRLLRLAYASRPDTEIAAHLGEVLWMKGERDEARRIWRDAQRRDADNEVLRETLSRLRVDL
ncbi:tetratricopeptide repeat protein [Calidifontimicrobium sp. SYSU G02091]|uniref:tetratricopeptide repeat protein n=1 Tax=Calidifontimicrobium sp. SYSU G02091 TaxID=2926421 RepID=UPI001F5360DE|nr:tetratricopeptide repeat protein [Calidifontimicrobium sp. SYSU G02091]MCI1193474.1 tetratricopeptide repeat protein [Calidifontimicrobium sp. SYSU G02091]